MTEYISNANLGPGLGEVATTFSSVNSPEMWLLTVSMLLGRLEIFTLLVLLAPALLAALIPHEGYPRAARARERKFSGCLSRYA